MRLHPVSLLVGCEADHAPFIVGIPERGEDPATDAKVGMTVVRLFDGVFEAERNTSEPGGRHAPIFDRPADAVKRSHELAAGGFTGAVCEPLRLPVKRMWISLTGLRPWRYTARGPNGGIVDTKEEIVRTQLEDLQSEFEAGARTINVIADAMDQMRAALLLKHLDQAALAGTLVRSLSELRESVRQQRETLRELRRSIRERDRPTL